MYEIAYEEWGYMKTPYLQPLMPFPIRIDENGMVGELNVRYNPDDHYMVVSFKYESKDHETAPLVVYLEVAGKLYRHVLYVCDRCNKLVKTALFKPEYNVWEGIRFCSISPLICRDATVKS